MDDPESFMLDPEKEMTWPNEPSGAVLETVDDLISHELEWEIVIREFEINNVPDEIDEMRHESKDH